MSDSLFVSTRVFQLWLYTVSHSTLLLRSVKSGAEATRIDLLFKSVRRISMSSTLNGVDLRIIPVSLLSRQADETADRCAMSLSGGTLDNWILCGSWASHEDDGEYGDPSHFSVPKLAWDP
jgi:hypothetical protein